jgi:hypothetical protein
MVVGLLAQALLVPLVLLVRPLALIVLPLAWLASLCLVVLWKLCLAVLRRLLQLITSPAWLQL